ncbi:MAG TPA: hypothetical protein VKZ60_12540 [Chloroflexota bacterium]|nr:hypothetical protein [Chloroflexota bacterium]
MAESRALRYDRLYRTLASEAYLLSLGETPLGRLELHFAQGVVYGLLLLEQELDRAVVRALLAQIDDDLVWTAGVAREDFVVSVFVGREVGVFDDRARAESEASPNGGGDGH